ncbi:MAG TPA: tRNA uridine-5-carboxymethylaminomethyl(34) synthesis GTPase MnmE [candidate division Zixibacteria bacterium]|nr:tRNA uridine-5-carboxymethylaminomethyl(34) synthesis GTPase MnmE [candidate division Zixibacteria bacterium]
MYVEDTIAAIATPPGEGAIAIIRVSGPDAEVIADKVFVRQAGGNGRLRSHGLYYGVLKDPGSQEIVDNVLLTVMRKPRSYTGETVVEIHCHGGPWVSRRVLEVVLAAGARHAEPGEFTRRAFLNGRLDLSQAEAVLDLIRARTAEGASLALSQARGGLSVYVEELRAELLAIMAEVEAAIDFAEEEIELLGAPELHAKINGLREKIKLISNSYQWGKLFREGAAVCICGRPNVGKSSLLNALLGEDRAIVTAVPGTTRDVIEDSMNLGGLPVVLWDTAGIRPTEDQVEKVGVELSLRHISKADAILLVLDGSAPLTDEDHALLERIRCKKALLAINKCDLEQVWSADAAMQAAGNARCYYVSARYGKGINDLKHGLRELLLGTAPQTPVVITNARHQAALARSAASLDRALAVLGSGNPPELASIDLQQAMESLEEIIGKVTTEDILEHIFTQFCIGK